MPAINCTSHALNHFSYFLTHAGTCNQVVAPLTDAAPSDGIASSQTLYIGVRADDTTRARRFLCSRTTGQVCKAQYECMAENHWSNG